MGKAQRTDFNRFLACARNDNPQGGPFIYDCRLLIGGPGFVVKLPGFGLAYAEASAAVFASLRDKRFLRKRGIVV